MPIKLAHSQAGFKKLKNQILSHYCCKMWSGDTITLKHKDTINISYDIRQHFEEGWSGCKRKSPSLQEFDHTLKPQVETHRKMDAPDDQVQLSSVEQHPEMEDWSVHMWHWDRNEWLKHLIKITMGFKTIWKANNKNEFQIMTNPFH